MDIFEPEVVATRRETWLREIIVAKPAGNTFLVAGFTMLAIFIVAYLFLGERTKRASVSGYLVPEEGLIKVYTQQPGTITEIKVKEGQFVKQGTVVATVSFERSISLGPLRQQIEQRLTKRKSSIDTQRLSSDATFTQQVGLVKQRIGKFQSDLITLDQSIASHKAGLTLTRGIVAGEAKLAQEGYMGKTDFQESQVRLMDQEHGLRQFERQKLSLARELIGAQMELQSLPARALAARSELMREGDDIAQQQIENEDRRENQVVAPTDGTVTAIQRGAGKFASPDQPVLSLVPLGVELMAHFYVTSEAVGFLRTGNEARLQFAAFPYQKFGSYQGQVVSVSRTAVPEEELPFPVSGDTSRTKQMYYIVKVKPEKEFVMAYGRKEVLQPGMRVDAKIWIDRRTLVEWIFEPLFSISGRM